MPGVDIKKDDNVRGDRGQGRGKRGRVVHVLPLEGRVMVDGVARAKKHSRTGAQRTATASSSSRAASSTWRCSSTSPTSSWCARAADEPTRVGHRLERGRGQGPRLPEV